MWVKRAESCQLANLVCLSALIECVKYLRPSATMFLDYSDMEGYFSDTYSTTSSLSDSLLLFNLGQIGLPFSASMTSRISFIIYILKWQKRLSGITLGFEVADPNKKIRLIV